MDGWVEYMTSPENYDIMWWFSVFLGIMAAFIHYPIKDKAIIVFGSK